MKWTDTATTERGTCGKCGAEYEPYLVFFKEGFIHTANRVEFRRKYGYVCQECLDEEMNGKGYATTDA